MKNQTWFSKAFNLPALQQSRLPWIDYLKGIAIILVVYRHAFIGIERSGIDVPVSLINANEIFYSFRMPLFFILSGVFISRSLAKRTIKDLIGIKFENLIYPYLIWSVIQITLQILVAGSGSANSHRGLIDYTYIFYQPQRLDQFWYLPALFNTTVIYLLFKEKLKFPSWAQLTLGLGFYFVASYFQQISMISDWMEFYFFFALGDAIGRYFFHESTQRFLKNPVSLLIITPIFFIVQVYYLTHTTNHLQFLGISLTGCLTMVILSFRLQSWNILNFLRIIGYHSLYIYVIHVIITAFTRTILTRVFGIESPEILLVSGIFMGATIPIIIYNLLIKDKIFWFLFSFRRNNRKPAVKTIPNLQNQSA